MGMRLKYSGPVNAPADKVWDVVSDLERMAEHLPGVRLEHSSENEVSGTVTVPLGPLRLAYRGEAKFIERDVGLRKAVIRAIGRDSHGEQAASAVVSTHVAEDGDGRSRITIAADVDVPDVIGPLGFAVDQFGNGLLKEFVARLNRSDVTVSAQKEARPLAEEPVHSEPGVEFDDFDDLSGDDLGDAIYPAPPPGSEPNLAKYAPYAGVLVGGVLLGWLLGRMSRRSRPSDEEA